jgi:hypothetical protein
MASFACPSSVSCRRRRDKGGTDQLVFYAFDLLFLPRRRSAGTTRRSGNRRTPVRVSLTRARHLSISATASWSWPTCRRRREPYRQRRPKPQGGFARQLEGDGDSQAQCHRQPQHPTAALGIKLIQDPGTRPATPSEAPVCLTVRERSPTYGALFRPKCESSGICGTCPHLG